MENKVKGTGYDVRSNRGYRRYCSNNGQYHCFWYQYRTIRQSKQKASKKQPRLSQKLGCFFNS